MPDWLNGLLLRGARGQPAIWVPIFGAVCFVLAWAAGQQWQTALIEGALTALAAWVIMVIGRRVLEARSRS
jgi:hypothetical protein